MNSLLNPKSIAVVGASREEKKLGYVLLKNVIEAGFAGEIFPVNPAGGEILGLKVLPDIPAHVDLVLVSVPSRIVPQVIESAARKRARSAVILASAFAEMGGEGKKLQEAILKSSRKNGMRVLGPNCMGIYNIDAKLNATYFWEIPKVEGNVSFISQSGAYGGTLFSQIRSRHFGIRKFISIGNQADLTHADFCEYLSADTATKVVAMFIEEVKHPLRFLRACSALASKKPVVIFKVGRTTAGSRATLSHTGSLAGDWTVFSQAMRQCGAFLAHDTDEFFDAICMFSAYPNWKFYPQAVAIGTISGGPCVAASDACEEAGIPVPELESSVQAKIRQYIPEFGATRNPVDMTPQMNPEQFPDAIAAIWRSKKIGGVVAINVGLDREQFAQGFINARATKPVTAFLVDDPEISQAFAEAHIPVFPTPERAARAFTFLAFRNSLPEPFFPVRTFSSTGKTRILSENESRGLLKGIPFCREVVSSKPVKIEFPVVVKVPGPHKSDRRGVVVGIQNEAELKAALKKLPRSPYYIFQEMVKGDYELIFGARIDATFGPYVLFGMGGIFTEFSREFVLRLCPISQSAAEAMICGAPFAKILAGARGRKPLDVKRAAKIIVSLSKIISSNKKVREIDLNPVIVRDGIPIAVDRLVAVATF